MNFLSMAPSGHSVRLVLAEAASSDQIEQEIARLPRICKKIELFCGMGGSDQRLAVAARAIAKSHIQNVEFQFPDEPNDGFQEALSVFTASRKQFNVLAHQHHENYQQIGQVFNALRTMRVSKLETTISSAGLETFSEGIPNAKGLRGLQLKATRFKKADFAQLKNAIERSDSIQHLTVEPYIRTRRDSCEHFVESLQSHLDRNKNYNEFVDRFGNIESDHFLDGRKGHLFVSAFLGQAKLTQSNENSEAISKEIMGKTELIAKGLAQFLKPADAIRMAVTSKASLKAVNADVPTYKQINDLRTLYKSSARSFSLNTDTDSQNARPNKKQKSI
jgi:hypothetical protein